MKPIVTVATLLAVAGGIALAPPAKADSFSFGYSSGGWHSRPWYGPPGHYRGPPHRAHYNYSYWSGPYWGPPAYRPRVVVVQPPPVAYYAPPPPVMYAPSPYGGQLSAVPASPVYQTANGQYCREYQAGVTVNGVVQPSYGTACLMLDGSWRVVN
ncbi:MAG: hypothetical protein VW600_18270 [Ferrovibrio sp.]